MATTRRSRSPSVSTDSLRCSTNTRFECKNGQNRPTGRRERAIFVRPAKRPVELQLQADNHRPWRLQSQVWWPVGAWHARVHIPRSAVQPLRLLGPLTALAGASAEEAHGGIFYIQGAHLAPHKVGWYGPSKYASVHMALCSPQPAH